MSIKSFYLSTTTRITSAFARGPLLSLSPFWGLPTGISQITETAKTVKTLAAPKPKTGTTAPVVKRGIPILTLAALAFAAWYLLKKRR